jgi:pimeloyl-ACP methyl ester carboxylesterase
VLKFFIYIIIIIPAILIGLGIAVYIFQEKLIFNPEKLSDKYKFNFTNEFEELTYETEDGNTINAILFKAINPKGIIYYHHGNAGNLEDWGSRAIDFTNIGYDVLMYDYRGYGKSSGKIKNEKMLNKDALMIYNKLLSTYKESDIILYGMSLGTGIATKLAHEKNPKTLILETPYYNFYDVSKYHYPYLPNSILLHYQFKTNKFLPEIDVPVYLFHGTEDETIPFDSSERLEKLSNNVKLFPIKDGSHNNLNTFKEYHSRLEEVLN